MSNLVNAIIGIVIAMVVSFIACWILFGVWKKQGKLDPAETGETAAEAAAAPAIPAVADDVIVAFADGELIGPDKMKDPMFAEESMGQTVAIEPTSGLILAPANGTLEMIFDTGHAFSVRMKDGTGMLIHIGVDTVNMKGEGFTVLKKQGDEVKAGEPVIRVDLKAVEAAGYSTQTMLVITEPANEEVPVSYIGFGPVTAGQAITK